jgi:hypothetical protein
LTLILSANIQISKVPLFTFATLCHAHNLKPPVEYVFTIQEHFISYNKWYKYRNCLIYIQFHECFVFELVIYKVFNLSCCELYTLLASQPNTNFLLSLSYLLNFQYASYIKFYIKQLFLMSKEIQNIVQWFNELLMWQCKILSLYFVALNLPVNNLSVHKYQYWNHSTIQV